MNAVKPTEKGPETRPLDVLAVCAAAGVPHRVTGRGWVELDCPRCRRPRHLGWNVRTGTLQCWVCGRLAWGDALPRLIPASVTGGNVWRWLDRYRQGGPRNWGEDRLEALPEYREPADTGHLRPVQRTYLLSRGFDPDHLESYWELRGCGPLAGDAAGRVLIPVADADGAPVGWTARAVSSDVTPRYLSWGPVRECVYGLYRVPVGAPLVVVEGPADVWRLGPPAVATLGTDWTEAQVAQIASRQPSAVAVLYDSDPDPLTRTHTRAKAATLAMRLGTFRPGLRVCAGLFGEVFRCGLKDPGDLTPEQATAVMECLRTWMERKD